VDTTRAQLPKRDDFEERKKSHNPFVFLGYDQANDVLVCWNFHIAKTRLNEKESVSFYSRQFFQEEVSLGIRKYLNPDLEDIFKITDISLLNLWLSKLFSNQEYMILDEIGKKMYSCALKKYIQFVEFLSSKETYIVAEPQAQYITPSKQDDFLDNEKRKSYILKVTYPNGHVVSERIVHKTLIDVIQNAGVYKVQELDIFINKVNLISDTVLPIYEQAQKPIGNGLYVMTNCSTDKKHQIIEQISKAFNMGLKVEKVSIL
jgi:hypothetical protein